jgi:hypothetical protein
MHHDAKRALIGVRNALMSVRNLGDCEDTEQDHAEKRHDGEGIRPAAGLSPEACL